MNRPDSGESLHTRLQDALSGTFTIEHELGGGGMSRVFVAEETRLGRKVVVKVLSPELTEGISVERFEREIRLAASLQHAHIVPLLSTGEVHGLPYFTMPFIEGESLRARLGKGQLPIGECVSILRDVARALVYAHGRHVVHRDIKPDNVMFSGGSAVVTDFGIAKALSASRTGNGDMAETLTQLGTSIGTPAYMAPEQAAGDPNIDARADIYSFGCTAYELLSGNSPFAGRTPQRMLAAHMAEAPRALAELRQDVPPALAEMVMRCLAKEPGARPQSANELVRMLEAVTSGPVNPIQQAQPHRRRAPAVIAVLACVVAVWLIFHFTSSTNTANAQTIAVLPFSNESGDSLQDYLSEGITDAVQLFLQKVPGLTVIGRASSGVAANGDPTPAEIGKRLGVTQYLRGVVRRRGDSLRVTAELVATTDGRTLWAQKFDRLFARAYALDDDIAAALVGELNLVLSGKALAVARAGRTRNPEAWNQYLLGMHSVGLLLEPSLRTGIAHFDSALVVDPEFALAEAGIAAAWSWLADEFVAPDSAYPQVKAHALRAVELDSLLAEAHVMLAMARMIKDLDLAEAEREFQVGMAMDSNSVFAITYYANIITFVRKAKCMVPADRAVKLDPLNGFASWVRTVCLYVNRRFDEAIVEERRRRELQPGTVYFDDSGAASLRELGRYQEALATYRRSDSLSKSLSKKPLFGLGITFARMGLRDSALRVAHALEALYRRRYISPEMIAMIYANLPAREDRDAAFRWMAEGDRVHSFFGVFRGQTPEYDLLRSDPRFQALLATPIARSIK